MSNFPIKLIIFTAIKYSIAVWLAFVFFDMIPDGSTIELIVFIVSFSAIAYLVSLLSALGFHFAIFFFHVVLLGQTTPPFWIADFVLIAISILGMKYFMLYGKGVSYKKEKEKSEAGEAYKKGDYETALQIAKPLAEQGDVDAQIFLGWMYFEGEGVPQNDIYAYMWFDIATTQTHTSQRTKIDQKNHPLIEGIKNHPLIEKFFPLPIDALALLVLGAMFYKADYVTFAFATILCLTLGLAWFFCFMMEENKPKKPTIYTHFYSEELYEYRLIELSSVLKNRMSKVDFATAKKYAREYGKNDYKGTQFAKEIRWVWYRLIENHHVIGRTTIGMAVLVYFMVTGIPFLEKNLQTYEARIKAYEESKRQARLHKLKSLATQGNNHAQDALTKLYIENGEMYEEGRGVPQDDKEATKWYRLAFEQYSLEAEQGDAWAQHNLGKMYLWGRAVQQDDINAYMWLSVSEYFGVEQNRLESRMSKVDLATAQKRAKKCIESNYKNC